MSKSNGKAKAKATVKVRGGRLPHGPEPRRLPVETVQASVSARAMWELEEIALREGKSVSLIVREAVAAFLLAHAQLTEEAQV